MLLRIVMRVIVRRMEAGEELETILLSYPKIGRASCRERVSLCV